MVYLIVKLLYSFAASVNFLLIAENLTIYKIKKGKLLYIVINTIAFYVITHYSKEFLLIPISTLIIFYVIYNNSKKLLYAIFICILADLIFVISEAIVTVFTPLVFHTYFENIAEDSFQYTLILLPIIIMSFIISRLLRKILNQMIAKNYEVINKFTINSTVIFYAAFALITIYINTIIYRYFIEGMNTKFLLVNAFMILGNFFIVVRLIHNNNKNVELRLQQEYRNREFEQLQEYVETIEKLSDDLRKFKHDYNNIFNAMGTYIQSNDINGLKKFYKEDLLPESEKIIGNDVTPYLLKNMKVNSLKGLIASKIVSANFNDIKTNIEILEEIISINISEIDVCRVIGIFFDNAIEAAVLCDDKIIDFAVIKSENDTSFIIRNTCPLGIPPIYKLKEKGFSTKGNNRGLGLAIVDDIINGKYTNLTLRTKIEEGMFTQELIVTK